MDNHKGETRRLDARALTEEIERATNHEQTERQRDVERQQAGNVYEGHEMGAAQISPEEVRRLGSAAMVSGEGLRGAEIEIRRDEIELEHPEEVVGDESQLQVAEHLAEDREDLQHEMGQGLRFEVKATNRGQEEVTRKVVPEVEKIVNQPSFRVRALEDVYHRGVNATLGVFNRRIGDRNGVGGNAA